MEYHKHCTSENFIGLGTIKPKFPEIPVQNQMERNISKTLFRKFRSTSGGCPFFRKFGNTGNFLFHLAFHHQIDLPDSPRRFLVSYPPQKRQYLLFGCNEWSPMWKRRRVQRKDDNVAKLAVVVLSVPLCDRRFHLWLVESGDKVCGVAVVLFRLSS